jgi:hypothetical protein
MKQELVEEQGITGGERGACNHAVRETLSRVGTDGPFEHRAVSLGFTDEIDAARDELEAPCIRIATTV